MSDWYLSKVNTWKFANFLNYCIFYKRKRRRFHPYFSLTSDFSAESSRMDALQCKPALLECNLELVVALANDHLWVDNRFHRLCKSIVWAVPRVRCTSMSPRHKSCQHRSLEPESYSTFRTRNYSCRRRSLHSHISGWWHEYQQDHQQRRRKRKVLWRREAVQQKRESGYRGDLEVFRSLSKAYQFKHFVFQFCLCLRIYQILCKYVAVLSCGVNVICYWFAVSF